MVNPDPECFAGTFRFIKRDKNGQTEHYDTLALKRSSNGYTGVLASELPGGFDSYQSHTSDITGKFNKKANRLELEFSWDEETYNTLFLVYRDGKVFGSYPDLGESWDEWERMSGDNK